MSRDLRNESSSILMANSLMRAMNAAFWIGPSDKRLWAFLRNFRIDGTIVAGLLVLTWRAGNVLVAFWRARESRLWEVLVLDVVFWRREIVVTNLEMSDVIVEADLDRVTRTD